MPEGIPNRLPALLWLAMECGWETYINPFPLLSVTFVNERARQIDLRWSWEGRLESAEYDPGNGQDWQRILLRDVPSILRGGS